MKKILLLLAAIMVTLTIDAQKMKFSGDNSCIKENVTANLVIDVSHATWEKKESFRGHFSDEFDEILNISKLSFIDGFNSNSQGLKLEESSNAPKYEIKISATNFFQRKGWGPYGRMVLKIWGNIEVVEIKTSQTVYSAKLDGFIGHADFKTTDRFAKLFMELGKSFSNK